MTKLSDSLFESAGHGRQAVAVFISQHLAAMPADPRAALLEAMGDPVPPTQFRDFVEALYAAIKTEGAEAMTGEARQAAIFLAGQCVSLVVDRWGTMTDGGRGVAIKAALRRELGETTTPAVSADPAVAARFAPPPEVAEPPAPAPVEPPQ